MIRDAFTVLIVSIFAVAVSLPIAGCLAEPTFQDRCVHCGVYFDGVADAHEHLAECDPCR